MDLGPEDLGPGHPRERANERVNARLGRTVGRTLDLPDMPAGKEIVADPPEVLDTGVAAARASHRIRHQVVVSQELAVQAEQWAARVAAVAVAGRHEILTPRPGKPTQTQERRLPLLIVELRVSQHHAKVADLERGWVPDLHGRPRPVAIQENEAQVERLVDTEHLSRRLLAVRKDRSHRRPRREPMVSVGEDIPFGVDHDPAALVLVLRLGEEVNGTRSDAAVQLLYCLFEVGKIFGGSRRLGRRILLCGRWCSGYLLSAGGRLRPRQGSGCEQRQAKARQPTGCGGIDEW
jgi:hypothetical protein